MWQRRMVAPVAALAVAATLLASVAASQKKAAGTICPGGRFLLGSGVVDPAAGEEAVVISGGFVSIAKACPPARAKLTPGRSGMRVKAAWRACSGLAGKVHLSATVEPGCDTMAGTVVAPRAKLRKRFAARRSECGDGVLDVGGGEQCEADGGCALLERCVACACVAGGSTTTTTSTLPPVSFSRDVQPIFTASCALPFCHVGPRPQQNLDLGVGRSYAALVDVPSLECPASARVQTGAPERSYLIEKLDGAGDCFLLSRMPLGGVLPAADIGTIGRWIREGARDN